MRLQCTRLPHGLMHWQTSLLWLVPVPDHANALDNATYLTHPVLPSRCLLPPTLTYCQGGAHGLQHLRPLRSSRSTIDTRLQCEPCCPLQAVLQAGDPATR